MLKDDYQEHMKNVVGRKLKIMKPVFLAKIIH